MITLLKRLARKGPRGLLRSAAVRAARPLHEWRTRAAPEYAAPSEAELLAIESRLSGMGVTCADYRVDAARLASFRSRFVFPDDYYGGPNSPVFDEKLLEHFVAWELIGIDAMPVQRSYVDIAGASSPWAHLLREQGVDAYSVDLKPDPAYAGLAYYQRADATAMPFADGSMGGASLQCAYEMFLGDADMRLLPELARVLAPGSRAVVLPLYMHVQPCYYQSPEHYGKPFGDDGAVRYLRRETWDIHSSRKYSPRTFVDRVWRPALAAGLVPAVLVLRNRGELGRGIYLHFVLTLDKPDSSRANS